MLSIVDGIYQHTLTMTIKQLHMFLSGLVENYGDCEVILSINLEMTPASMEFTAFEREENPNDSCLVIRDDHLAMTYESQA